MQKSSLILLVLGTLILSGCTNNNTISIGTITPSEKVQSGTQDSQPSTSLVPQSMSLTGTTTISTTPTSPETALNTEITGIIGVDMSSYTLRSDIQAEYNRRKNNAAIDGDKNYTFSPSIEKELSIGNIHIYTLNPFAKSYEKESCTESLDPTCISFVVDTESKAALFTDIDSKSVGVVESFDSQKKIAYFSEAHGEGNMCSSGFVTTYHAVVIGDKELVTKIINNTGRCNNENCDCSNQKDDWIETESIAYMKEGREVPATTDIREIFDFIKK